jgi:hypothetical protein
MNIKQNIKLTDIVSGTSTNVDGCALFFVVDKIINANNTVYIDLTDATPLSSSFLNSSIGELIDKYGITKIKQSISYKNATSSMFNNLKNYYNILETMA